MDLPESSAQSDGATDLNKKRKNPFSTQLRKEDKERRLKKKARIIARNISYKAKEDVLRKHFSQWGNVEELNLLKRPDGKLVGCAFVQYSAVNQASKAILKGNKLDFLGRPLNIDWALGKDEYTNKKNIAKKEEPDEKKPKLENKTDGHKFNEMFKEEEDKSDEEDDKSDRKTDDEGKSAMEDELFTDSDEDEKGSTSKLKIGKINKEKLISNDVQNGCTIFIKNVPFDAEDTDIRKVFRKFGPVHYAIVNREPISGHSKGTAFVKFKNKASAELCLQSGAEISLMDQFLEPYPALSKDEIRNQERIKSNKEVAKDSRNLYLAREGLIMANSKSAEGVSASDMAKRHKLEQIKTQVLKNLNRFVSRNRLSIHNLPLNFDNEKLKRMVITYAGFRPHECRVMRENKITPEHPKGKSKGFGFMSFSTHQEALSALRKLNNNPSIFGTQHRPIVAFSIEDRAVEKIKEKRKQKSKINNPTFLEKMEKIKENRKLKKQEKLSENTRFPQSDNKEKLKKHIKKLEESRSVKANAQNKPQSVEELDNFVGTAAKPGSNIRMRSNKKIAEQSQEHKKNVKAKKRKEKAKKIRQIHLAERKSIDRPKQGKREERDDLEHLVKKYKLMIDSRANVGSTGESHEKESQLPKRTKWYTE
ncbi:PREDICTED: RNA-binding protein 28 [Rhagoletis zephyria]|uniref:RNA-binding protein 28 n=1 Tax=Rhagoletis zephyria TaxID=28612 RepID=UPI000811927A|nr:PREDICTED: RNA-binding protein 28 [Rhagoletis zephyria]XP_036330203.1 RNA-binding protein 28 [Rhagoletis pomonella]